MKRKGYYHGYEEINEFAQFGDDGAITSSAVSQMIELDRMKKEELEESTVLAVNYEGEAGKYLEFILNQETIEYLYSLMQGFSDWVSPLIGQNNDLDSIISEEEMAKPFGIQFYNIDNEGPIIAGNNGKAINHLASLEIPNAWLGQKALLAVEIDEDVENYIKPNLDGICSITTDNNNYSPNKVKKLSSFYSETNNVGDCDGIVYKNKGNKTSLFFSNKPISGGEIEILTNKLKDIIIDIASKMPAQQAPDSEGLNIFAKDVNKIFNGYIEEYGYNEHLYMAYIGKEEDSQNKITSDADVRYYTYFKGSDKIYLNLWDVAIIEDKKEVKEYEDKDLNYKNMSLYSAVKPEFNEENKDENSTLEKTDLRIVACVDQIDGADAVESNGANIIDDMEERINKELINGSKEAYDAANSLVSGMREFGDFSYLYKVANGNEITLKIRIYNEGLASQGYTSDYIKKINLYIPNKLEFIADDEINSGWEAGGTVNFGENFKIGNDSQIVSYNWTENIDEGENRNKLSPIKTQQNDSGSNEIINQDYYQDVYLKLKVNLDDEEEAGKVNTAFIAAEICETEKNADVDSKENNLRSQLVSKLVEDDAYIVSVTTTDIKAWSDNTFGEQAGKAIGASLMGVCRMLVEGSSKGILWLVTTSPAINYELQ